MLRFKCKSFDVLNTKELHSILALRAEVFVVEQKCVYQDVDGKDPLALHLIGVVDDEVLAYARIFAQGIAYENYASIGRIVTSPSIRGKKIGHSLVANAIQECKYNYPEQHIKISAQSHLEKFYRTHGFLPTGEAYLEDGIPHIGMTLDV